MQQPRTGTSSDSSKTGVAATEPAQFRSLKRLRLPASRVKIQLDRDIPEAFENRRVSRNVRWLHRFRNLFKFGRR